MGAKVGAWGMTTPPIPYWTTRTLESTTAAAPFTWTRLRNVDTTCDGTMFVMKNHASGEVRLITLPAIGSPVPVIRSSALPVSVAVVLLSVAYVWTSLSMVSV